MFDHEPQPEMLLRLFDYSNDAQYVLDRETRRFLMVNPAFERLTGFGRNDLIAGHVTADDLITDEDRPRLARLDDPAAGVETDVYEMQVRCSGGALRPVEVSVHNVVVAGRRVRIGSLRDISQRKALEGELKAQVNRGRQNAIDIAQAMVRVYHLTERTENAPRLAAEVLRADSEDALFGIAATALLGRDPVGYRSVAIYLAHEGRLVLRCGLGGQVPREVDPVADPRLGPVARQEVRFLADDVGVVVPLASGDVVLGVLAVEHDPWERELLRDAPEARQVGIDILATVATVLGLKVSNLRLYEAIKRQTVVDDLTGVFNRRYLDQKAAEEFHRARRYGRDMAIVMVDVDRFKEVNDTRGHQQGDAVLKLVADILYRRCRQEDVFCRYGGDEFVAILPETDLEGARLKAEEFRAIVEVHPFPAAGDDAAATNGRPSAPLPRVSISAGVAAISTDVRDLADLFRRADEAMYRAKRGGRNLVGVDG